MFEDDIANNTNTLHKSVCNKSVLVIGGAGSIGSSFIKSILPLEPKTLVVIDVNENSLAELSRDLRSTPSLYVPEDYIPYPVDFSSNIFSKIFRARRGFGIVVSFSAHKHVRSEKDIFSVEVLVPLNKLYFCLLLKYSDRSMLASIYHNLINVQIAAGYKGAFELEIPKNTFYPGRYPTYLWLGDEDSLQRYVPARHYEVLDEVLHPLCIEFTDDEKNSILRERLLENGVNIHSELKRL